MKVRDAGNVPLADENNQLILIQNNNHPVPQEEE